MGEGRIAANVESILHEIGEDPQREGLLRTPMRAALWMLLFNVGLNVLCVRALGMDVAGMTLSTALTSWGNLVWLLFALGYNTSTAVWVGVIALLGLDAQTGVVMLLYLTLAHRERAARGALRSESDLEEAIVDGAARRLRPKLMTVAAMIAGLLPLLWSDGVGADVMKRVAAPMAGGLVSSFALELLVYPALFAAWKQRSLARGETPA